MTRKIVDAAKAIYQGKQNILKLGNLNAVRDWGHAKDYVKGMWLMMQYPTAEDWILATGQTCTVREFTTKVFAKLGVKIHWTGTGLYEVGMDNSGRLLVRVDERYHRPNDVEYLQGDPIKAYEKLDHFRMGERFFPWLYTIGYNHARNFVQRGKPLKQSSDDDVEKNSGLDYPSQLEERVLKCPSEAMPRSAPAAHVGKGDGAATQYFTAYCRHALATATAQTQRKHNASGGTAHEVGLGPT